MLGIRQVKHLSRPLETSPTRLVRLAESAASYVDEYTLLDPARPDKSRDVIAARGFLRDIQTRLYRRVLLPKLVASPYSHGGIVGRNIKTNVRPHRHSHYLLKSDVSDFYPSVHYSRVYRLFAESLECSPDVARICTLLCTYKHHLALGLVTSPILADRLMRSVDQRLGHACEAAGLAYTRFVDDLTISALFELARSGFALLAERVLSEHGFRVNVAKHQFASLADGAEITGIRVCNGKLDAEGDYVRELERQLNDASSLATGRDFAGPFFSREQMRGRMQFVCWVNPGRRLRLARQFGSIDWDAHAAEAARRALVVNKKKLVRKQALA